jgi:hypothetical protein
MLCADFVSVSARKISASNAMKKERHVPHYRNKVGLHTLAIIAAALQLLELGVLDPFEVCKRLRVGLCRNTYF